MERASSQFFEDDSDKGEGYTASRVEIKNTTLPTTDSILMMKLVAEAIASQNRWLKHVYRKLAAWDRTYDRL